MTTTKTELANGQRYAVVPKLGHFEDTTKIVSTHATLAAARRACGKTTCVAITTGRKGDTIYRDTYPQIVA